MCYATDFVNFIGSEGTNFVVSFSPKGYIRVSVSYYTQCMHSYYILPSPPTLHFSLCATAYYIYESISSPPLLTRFVFVCGVCSPF